ncbi:MAG: hypothetical protein ACR2QU_02135 [Gammaproteobacteria bacterium]
MTSRNIHLVGSIGLESAGDVFQMLGDVLGDKATRYPDGEPGVRDYWIVWQSALFRDHADFEFGEKSPPLTEGSRELVRFRVREGVNPKAIEFPPLGYAAEALKSFQLFSEFRDNGKIPSATRFQVCLPTPAAVVGSFVVPEHAADILPAYTQAMVRELNAIVEGIPNEDLAIQWDICLELVAYDGGWPYFLDDPRAHVLESVPQLLGLIPETVVAGFHLCYGDPGHKHIVEPKNLATSVDWTNGICANSPRRVDFVHMPVPRDRNDDDYFAPLKDLDIGETELSLGLVHHTDGLAGTQARIDTASKFVSDFGIATECGFGRRPVETIPELLRIHVEAAG